MNHIPQTGKMVEQNHIEDSRGMVGQMDEIKAFNPMNRYLSKSNAR